MLGKSFSTAKIFFSTESCTISLILDKKTKFYALTFLLRPLPNNYRKPPYETILLKLCHAKFGSSRERDSGITANSPIMLDKIPPPVGNRAGICNGHIAIK